MKNLILNIAFILYATLLNDRIAARMDAVITSHRAWPAMAVTLFVLSLLEAFLLPAKIRHVFFKTGRTPTPNQTAVWFMLPLIFRMLVGLAIAVSVFSFLVPDIGRKPPWAPVAAGMAVILVVKEVYLLLKTTVLLARGSAKQCSGWIEWAADLIVLIISCIVFSLVTRPGFFFTSGQIADPFMMPLIIFCFFAWLLSLRLGFLVEEFLTTPSLTSRLVNWLSMLAAAVTAAWTLM